jgi:hypothetical protein
MQKIYKVANKIEQSFPKFVLAPLSFLLAIICLLSWTKGANTFTEFVIFGSTGLVMLTDLHYGLKSLLCIVILYLNLSLNV